MTSLTTLVAVLLDALNAAGFPVLMKQNVNIVMRQLSVAKNFVSSTALSVPDAISTSIVTPLMSLKDAAIAELSLMR